MKKAIKIFVIIFAVSLVISIASTVFLFKNKDEIMGNMSEGVSKFSEEASQLAEQATALTTEKEKETEKTTKEHVKKEEKQTTKEENKDAEILNSFVGKPLEEFIAKVDEMGYKATYLAQGVDSTGFIKDIADLYFTGELEIDCENKTVLVTLVSKSGVVLDNQKKALKEKLDPYYAWKAVEEYGIAEYYDFELHYISGKIAEELEDENTWFLKATCTVFGTEQVCEAKVTGTTDNPEVIDFYFYS